MTDAVYFLSVLVAISWLLTILLPWQPWRNNQVLQVTGKHQETVDLSEVTVLIPARNEADVIAKTLASVVQQGQTINVIVVDDESSDGTAEVVNQATDLSNLSIISTQSLPDGWTGKLWAQEQGLKHITTKYTLLLDADIELQSGVVYSLIHKMEVEGLHFVSLMAVLRVVTFWEKLLLPAFIYFFKMLYPFALANRSDSQVAAAAGGCILVQTDVLRRIGGMAAIKHAVIDDCTLAKKVKSAGYKIWIGLTHDAVSQRQYINLQEIWEMVARTAFTQLHYSFWLLIACSVIMLLMYGLPIVGLFYLQGAAYICSVISITIMVCAFYPTLKFYSLHLGWAFTMPLIASLYLLMTWSSALRYWRGERSRWKGRIYQKI